MLICYFEINFNFNISKNVCQFAKMSPEFTDTLFICTELTHDTKDANTVEVSKNIPLPSHKTREGKGGRGVSEENVTF